MWVAGQLGCGGRGAERTVSKESVPPAFVAPARSEAGKQEIPAARLDAQSDRVAVWTVVALGEQIKEEYGSKHGAEDEKSADYEDAQNRVPHRCYPPALAFG